MNAILPFALVLVCPLVMGAMMLWMHRRGRGTRDERDDV
jgi:hypothetical protein